VTQIINSLADISERYDALFCDLWGCVHDGINPFDEALAAMQTFRQKGGSIILVTNSPRPHTDVQEQLLQIGIAESFYDRIATSGDSARAAMFSGVVGRKVYFLGQPHDQSFFSPPDIYLNTSKITQVNIEQAEGIICCGPFNPLANLKEIQPQLLIAKTKGLKLLCANPDIVVDRGPNREWCAGAVAKLYTEMGGTSIYFGKPHPPIYALARNLLDGLKKNSLK
jgi:HAD superfamily hydrolase (TIGR01459 family)